jgi:hypothetical protein
MTMRSAWVFALFAALIGEAGAQQFVYPAKGQTPQQQKSDEAACHAWAVQQTGFDPAKPPPPQQAAYGKARAACLEGCGYSVK